MKKLIEAGFSTPEKIAEATVDALSEVQGIGLKTAERIIAAARGEQVDEAETEAKSE
jgi:transcription termination factor NusA